ncbi:MAG: MTH1187 family thiamine-binding protein [candidate division WOR-3 bacterium]|jgi:uncharacterized protein (TIGR00106 family)
MAVMEISVVPIGTKSPSLSQYVAEVLKVLKNEPDIKYQLTSMGTIIEAKSVEKLLLIAGKMHSIPFDDKVKRVVTTIKLDERTDKELTMGGKVKSVEEKLS